MLVILKALHPCDDILARDRISTEPFQISEKVTKAIFRASARTAVEKGRGTRPDEPKTVTSFLFCANLLHNSISPHARKVPTL
jgi:hypothetical protein